MKSAIIVLLVLLGIIFVFAAIKGDGAIEKGLKESLIQGRTIIPMIIVAVFIMGFSEVLIPPKFVEQWLSESSGTKGIMIAWVAGILTPAGSIIGMPIAAGLYKAGASLAVIITYLTSIALLSIIRIPLEIGFYGTKLMLIRVLTTMFLPPLIGFMIIFIQKLFKI